MITVTGDYCYLWSKQPLYASHPNKLLRRLRDCFHALTSRWCFPCRLTSGRGNPRSLVQDQHKQSLRCCNCTMRGRHRRTSTAPPGPQTIRDEPCHIPPRRSPSQVPMISPRASLPPSPQRKPRMCFSWIMAKISSRAAFIRPSWSLRVRRRRKKKTSVRYCAEPTVLIPRCHGLAFPSPQSCDHTTAYRCREARCREALRSPLPLPLPRSSGADPSHLPFKTNMRRSRCLEINRQTLPLLLLLHAHARTIAISHTCADGKRSVGPLRGARVRGGGAACVGREAALAMHLSIIVEDARISPSAGSTSPGGGGRCAQAALFQRRLRKRPIFGAAVRASSCGPGARCLERYVWKLALTYSTYKGKNKEIKK